MEVLTLNYAVFATDVYILVLSSRMNEQYCLLLLTPFNSSAISDSNNAFGLGSILFLNVFILKDNHVLKCLLWWCTLKSFLPPWQLRRVEEFLTCCCISKSLSFQLHWQAEWFSRVLENIRQNIFQIKSCCQLPAADGATSMGGNSSCSLNPKF